MQIQPKSFLGYRDEDFWMSFLTIYVMAVIVFSGVESFEQIVNMPLTEDLMWNLVKIGQEFSEKTFKDYMILYMCIAQGHNFDCN